MASTADPFSNAIWSSWSSVWNPTDIVRQGQGLRLSNNSSCCLYRIIWHIHTVRFHHCLHPHWSSTSINRSWNRLIVGLQVERTEYFNWAPQREAEFFLYGVRFTEGKQWKQMPSAQQAHTWTWLTHTSWKLDVGRFSLSHYSGHTWRTGSTRKIKAPGARKTVLMCPKYWADLWGLVRM